MTQDTRTPDPTGDAEPTPSGRWPLLTRLTDRAVPGPGSALDANSAKLHAALTRQTSTGPGRAVATALHGSSWLGHPLHPVLVLVPVGAWTVTSWNDLRAARAGDAAHDVAADAALRVGIVSALGAAVTGVAQFLHTRGSTRRQTATHAALNNVALSLYVTSSVLRRREKRGPARLLAAVALGVVGVSGYLGDDLAYRHGVGVSRDPRHPAP